MRKTARHARLRIWHRQRTYTHSLPCKLLAADVLFLFRAGRPSLQQTPPHLLFSRSCSLTAPELSRDHVALQAAQNPRRAARGRRSSRCGGWMDGGCHVSPWEVRLYTRAFCRVDKHMHRITGMTSQPVSVGTQVCGGARARNLHT